MTVDKFIKKFTVNPIRDIEPNFQLTKEIDLILRDHKGGCFNCGKYQGQCRDLQTSSSWCSVQYCMDCNHLNVIYHQDHMGGNHFDIIRCFTDKTETK